VRSNGKSAKVEPESCDASGIQRDANNQPIAGFLAITHPLRPFVAADADPIARHNYALPPSYGEH
jgi:hypothetical protein